MKSINITIGRQLGSGGRLIGKALAEHYSLPFYDKEILLLAARESGLQTKFFEKFDECAKRRFMGLFYVESPIASPAIFKFQSDVIREKAKQGGVFVGRCADYILRDLPNLLRIFISANEADRIKLITKYNDVTPEVAAKQMLTADSARADYYNF